MRIMTLEKCLVVLAKNQEKITSIKKWNCFVSIIMATKKLTLFKKRSAAAKLGWVTRKKHETAAKRLATLKKNKK